MSINAGMAAVSGDFLIGALASYSVSVLAFAGDFAFGRPRRTAAAAGVTAKPKVAQLATVGGAGSAPKTPAAPAESMPELPASPYRAARDSGRWVMAGVGLAIVGVLLHTVAVVTRGLAVHRAPWGNMYEFVTALTCVAVVFFLGVMIRYRAWSLGLFVMGSVVLALGLAETVIYTAAGPLVPALQSYWLTIHVAAMTLATGIFMVAAVLGLIYLFADRAKASANGILARLPAKEQIDRLTYRTVVFGFPVWTFGVIAGAIWADQAWGRYWGWDPVETFAFITWVLYAAFLHARATAGWRGKRAHYVQLLGFASLVFNILVVQTYFTGLHSYAGLGG